ncbi:MAG: 30S ribosomal protein S20 [Clostridia bacterium]|nr:30S ribosomal protein S20 [Clostridia bacterium]
MPNIKSAKKRCLVISTKTLQNKMIKSELKSSIKKFETLVEAGDKEAAKAAYVVAVQKIEKAAKTNNIHKNNANRKKSALTLKLNKLA